MESNFQAKKSGESPLAGIVIVKNHIIPYSQFLSSKDRAITI